MKPLETRRWYNFMCLAISIVLMCGIWHMTELQLSSTNAIVFIFSTMGLFQAVHGLLALALIKAVPSLGIIK